MMPPWFFVMGRLLQSENHLQLFEEDEAMERTVAEQIRATVLQKARADLDALIRSIRAGYPIVPLEIVQKIKRAFPSAWPLIQVLIEYRQSSGSGRVIWDSLHSTSGIADFRSRDLEALVELAEIFGRPVLRRAIEKNYGVVLILRNCQRLDVFRAGDSPGSDTSAFIVFRRDREISALASALLPYAATIENASF